MDHNDDSALAAEYALGLLAPEDARVVAMRVAEDRAFAAMVRDWERHFAGLAEEVAPVEPPAHVLQALRSELFPEQDQPWWRRLGLIPAILGAAAAAMIAYAALTFGWLTTPGQDVPQYQASIAAEDQSLIIAAAYFEEDGRLLVDRQQGGARPGRALELWLIPEGAEAAISLGVLPAETLATLTIPAELRAGIAGGLLAISDEPPGGSPTGVATGDILAVGEITAL